MPTHLSPEWLAALDAAVVAHPGLADATRGVDLTIEQVVTADEGEPVVWHVAIHDGDVRVVPGPPPAHAADGTAGAMVRFTTDRATARAVASGTLTAQEAFMAGRLRVGGDTTALVAHHDLLAGLGNVFAGVALDD